MINKERFVKLVKICERAEAKYGNHVNTYGKRVSRLMDLEAADKQFNLRLDELLESDDENFYHDVFGIWRESVRTYPCSFGTFVPRFSGKGGK